MSIKIAGRQIKIGDSLYHQGLDSWGSITGFDPSGSAHFTIKGPSGSRKLMAQKGGIINGRRQLYWHAPIKLDLPTSNVQKVQLVVDAIASLLAPAEEE